jgi:hypothetical protein
MTKGRIGGHGIVLSRDERPLLSSLPTGGLGPEILEISPPPPLRMNDLSLISCRPGVSARK